MVSEEEVTKIVATALGVDNKAVNRNSKMADFPEWDSLGHLTILAALEDELGDRFSESEELSTADSISDLILALNS